MLRVRRFWLIASGAAAILTTAAFMTTCGSGCCAQQVVSNAPYRYGIAGSATHCADLTQPCPAANPEVVYLWPVMNARDDNVAHPVRQNLLNTVDAFLLLPFVETDVALGQGWLYSQGNWHHALDFSRPAMATFPVRAAADGTVIHIGWDNWSGNTVIVSHTVGGVADAYRTIYMHLRNGADQDCENSWARSVMMTASGAERDDYKAHLNTTGCPEERMLRNPVQHYWGTNSDKIDDQLLSRTVQAGDMLGWAGETGPGGHRTVGLGNTHLHIFFARRDTADGQWYFFDPYGIYGVRDCYPRGITDAPDSTCATFPVAWRDGRPQYPSVSQPPIFGCDQAHPCPPGLSCQNGTCLPSCTDKCPVFPHPGNCFTDAQGQCKRDVPGTRRQDCDLVLGVCPLHCFRDAAGACRIDRPVTERQDCPLVCLP
jgi:peptidase M23-like protein